jgi:uncharacterized protein YggE
MKRKLSLPYLEQAMKKIFLILAALLCAVAAQAEPAPKPGDKQVLHVSADAAISVKPDRAHLTLGVSERSKDLRATKERMSETLKKAIAFCKANGVQDKHIQTSYISISPAYRYDDDKAKSLLRHYALTQTFTVTLENPDTYETLLYALLELGINNVQNVSFTTSELRKYRDEARLAAVRAAQEKAKLLTDAVGIKLGKVVNIQEGQRVSPAYTIRSKDMLSQNVLAKSAPEDAGEGFALGMIPVKAEVTVSYELE